MQKLAMMMAVMILGMSPAHGYSIGADPRSLEVGGQVEMMPLLPRWYSDDGTLIARNTVSSVAAEGNQPVEPGGHLVGRTLQQTQLRIGDLERIRNRILRLGQDNVEVLVDWAASWGGESMEWLHLSRPVGVTLEGRTFP